MTLRTSRKKTTIYLLRHAHSQANGAGILAGQKKGVKLSAQGRKEASALIQTLTALDIEQIHVSPMERCRETIQPFLELNSSIDVFEEPAFIEMHYGEWTGAKLSSLARKSLWKPIQKNPSLVRFPKGESFTEMSTRAIEGIARISELGGNHLVVSHGDVIRVIINHFTGAHLDNFQRLSIGPASLSTIVFHGGSASIHAMNIPVTLQKPGESTLGGGSGKR